jgi:hypothetical protein
MEENLYQYSILKSGIQKYIRRSNKEKALLCVAKLLKKYSSYSQWLNLVNRLGVIACEDISIADLTLIYFLMRQIETIRSNTINRVDYIKINFENKYKLLAPLIVLMSECEKCRITDHIFHGVYSTVEDKPYILDCISGEKKECDLDNCIDLRHDGIIYYWNFYDKNESKLAKNPRIGMMYNVWRKMKPEDKTALLEQADYYLKNINDL